MKSHRTISRRRFVAGTAGSGLILGLGESFGLLNLPAVATAEVKQVGKTVRLEADVEPTVRFLEETPRERILEEVLVRIRKDLSYRELVAALLLAGIRNIPGAALAHHRNVGGALHGVFVIYSAHLASLNCLDQQRWIPILFAVDQFKHWQSRPPRVGEPRRPAWNMLPLSDSTVPTGTKARAAFVDALENWDEEAAEPAAAGMARSLGAEDAFDLLSRYAVRDYRYIGHKTIFVANAYRTLQCVGWRHAEPVLRSLSRALTAYFHREGHPAKSDLRADRSWRHNLEIVGDIREDWQGGAVDEAASKDLLATLRDGSDKAASEQAVELLNRGISLRSLWDGVMCAVSEIIMRWPDFSTLHAATTMNAMHFAFQTTRDEETRKLILLQAAAFATIFRGESQNRVKYDERIDELEPLEIESSQAEAPAEIMAELATDRVKAARKTLSYLQRSGDPRAVIRGTQQLMLSKGNNEHDYKFGSAVWGEDFWSISSPWRERQLAATLFLSRTPTEPDAKVFRTVKEIAGETA